MVVIDRDPLGRGASTRNGGMVIPELKAGPAGLTARYGPVGRRMYDEVNQAFDQVEALVADEGIDCDYERTGQLYLAHNRAHVDALAGHGRRARRRAGRGGPLRDRRRPGRRDRVDRLPRPAWCSSARAPSTPPSTTPGWPDWPLAAGADVHDRTTALAIEPRAREAATR